MAQTEITLNLVISAEDYLAHYQGAAKEVVARSIDGKNVRFPSNILQQFVTHSGIEGTFVISVDGQGKFQGIRKISSMGG